MPMPSREGKYVCSVTCRVKKKETFDALEERYHYLKGIETTLPTQSAYKYLKQEFVTDTRTLLIWVYFQRKLHKKLRERLKKRSLSDI